MPIRGLSSMFNGGNIKETAVSYLHRTPSALLFTKLGFNFSY